MGGTSNGTAIASAELYMPVYLSQTETATLNPIPKSMSTARAYATGSALSDGSVTSVNDGLLLVAGGSDGSGNTLSSSEIFGFPWVKTDALEYAPGTPVNITGGGFQPGETVTLHFQESPYYDSHPDLTAVVQADGTFSNSQFSPDVHDLNINFFLTGTGSTSSYQAQTLFADSAAASLTITASPSAASGGSITLAYTNNGGSGKNQTLTTPQTNLGTQAGSAFTISSIGAHNGCTWIDSASGVNVSTTGGGGASVSGTTVSGTEATGGQTLSITLNFANCTTTTTLTSSLNPSTYGQQVTFTASVASGGSNITSASGETITFKDGSTTLGTGTLNSSGQATFTTSATQLPAGSNSITAVYGGDSSFSGSTSSTLTQTVDKATPTITFGTAPTPTYLGGNFTVSATTTNTDSSTLTYSVVSGPCALVSGSTFSSTGAGTCVVQASGAATANFNAATGQQSVTIARATPTLSVTNSPATYTGVPQAAAVVGSVPGSVTNILYSGSAMTPTNAGTYVISATFAPTDTANYATLTAAPTGNFIISQAISTVTVSFTGATDNGGGNFSATYNGNPFTPTAIVSGVGSGVTQTVTWTGCTTITMVGTCMATANYAGDTNHSPSSGSATLSISPAVPDVTWAAPANILYGTALSATQLNANSNGVAGTFTYTPASGTILSVGPAQTLKVHFAPTDAVDYTAVDLSVTINVLQATPLMMWQNPADITYGTALSSTQLDAIALPPAAALTGWWNGEGNPNDSISGNNGTLQGGATYATGVVGQAFSFPDASGDGVSIHYNSGYDLNSTGFAAAVWVQGSSNSNGQETILEKSYDGSTGWSFQVNSASGLLAFDIGEGSNTFAQVLSTINVLDGNFHSVVGTWDGGTKMWLYVDGALQGTATLSASPANNTGGLNIGFSSGGGSPSQYFRGTVDEVQIFRLPAPVGTYVYTPAATTVLNAGKGQALSVAFTPTDGTNFSTATASASINVNQAAASINVTPYNVTYDGTARTATGTATGVGNVDLSADLTLTDTTHTTAGTYTDTWTFHDPNGNYADASGTISDVINKATPSIAWTTPAAITYGTALSSAQLDASSTVAGSFTYTPDTGTVLGAGTQTLSVTLTPTDTTNYTTATRTVQFTVNQATPTITWGNPADITYGTALSGTQLNATVTWMVNGSPLNVSGTATYTPPAGTLLNAGSGQMLSVNFTPSDTTNYTTATKNVTINVLKATPMVAFSNIGPFTYSGTAQAPAYVVNGVHSEVLTSSAIASYSGTQFDNTTYGPLAAAPTNGGTYTQTVAFAANNNYNALSPSATQAFTIQRATPTAISITKIPVPALLSGSFAPVVTVTSTPSGDPGATSVVSNTPSTCTVSGGTVSFVAVGTCSLTASVAATTNYAALTGQPQTFNIGYGFLGLQAPYAGPPTTFNVQRTMPLAWQYTNANGVVVNSAGVTPQVQISGPYGCGTTDNAGDITVTSAGNSGYQYDSTTNTWQFNWQVKGNQPGCYNIYIVTIVNGQTLQTSMAFPISVTSH